MCVVLLEYSTFVSERNVGDIILEASAVGMDVN